jgi:hypothetical protein
MNVFQLIRYSTPFVFFLSYVDSDCEYDDDDCEYVNSDWENGDVKQMKNNFVNETSVEQNNLLSFVSFDREHHCDQTYLGDENCVICTEKFDEDDHLPILLPCGHIFCLKCTTVLARKKHTCFVHEVIFTYFIRWRSVFRYCFSFL